MTVKVAVVSRRMRPGFWGGLEDHAAVLAEGLIHLGVEVAIFTSKASGDVLGSDSRLRGSHVFRLPDRFWDDAHGPELRNFVLASRLGPFDLLLCESGSGLPLLAHIEASDPPLFTISHGNLINEVETFLINLLPMLRAGQGVGCLRWLKSLLHHSFGFLQRKEFALFRRANFVVVNKEDIKRCKRLFNLSARQIFVVPNGVPPNSQVSSDARTYDLAFIGRLTVDKAPELFVRAVVALSRKVSVRAVVAGDGPLADELKGLASEVSCSSTLEFLGKVSASDIQSILAQTHLVVIPSRRRESMPLAYLEALAAGCEVIASDRPGLRGTRDCVDRGFLQKGWTPESWAHSMYSILTEKVGVEHERSSSLYTNVDMAARYLNLAQIARSSVPERRVVEPFTDDGGLR